MKVLRVIDMLTLKRILELSRDDFKGTVSVISSDPPCKNDNTWLTTIHNTKVWILVQLAGLTSTPD